MTTPTTILHADGRAPDEVEQALAAIFAREERPQVLRLEGTYSAVLARLSDPALVASYRYLICRPQAQSRWTPLLELGNRTVGLDVELSRALGGCGVFSIFVYGDAVSGYRLARDGAEVDRYLSDPPYFASLTSDEEVATAAAGAIEAERGHPERFADLLPAGTAPEDFVRVVLRPGWWEQHDASVAGSVADTPADASGIEDDEMVDEPDRMRCIALALECWGPTEYPFAQELEDIPNRVVGPAIALAFA